MLKGKCKGPLELTDPIFRIIPPDLINRRTLMAQLHNVEVYSTERVIIEWVLSLGENRSGVAATFRVFGRTDSGRVKITQEGHILKIILRQNDIDSSRPPLELQEEMTKLCGITDRSYVAILHWILIERDLNEIEEVLQRRGVPNSLPEFDRLPHDMQSGEALVFSGLDALNLDDEDTTQRRYMGRSSRRQERNGHESTDVVKSFIDKFNLASSFQKKLTQSWQEAEAQNMLSHICRLENMDPFMLLPQNHDPWTQRLKKAGGFPDDWTGVLFNERPEPRKKQYSSRSARTFPAIVEVGNGRIKVGVSTTAKSMVDEELSFAGELHVSGSITKRSATHFC